MYFLTSCTGNHTVAVGEITSAQVTFYSRSDDGLTNATRFTLEENTAEIKQLRIWLEENRRGWEPYIVSPAAGDYLIQAETFSLIIHPTWAILNYKMANGEYSQLYKKINRDSLKFIEALNAT